MDLDLELKSTTINAIINDVKVTIKDYTEFEYFIALSESGVDMNNLILEIDTFDKSSIEFFFITTNELLTINNRISPSRRRRTLAVHNNILDNVMIGAYFGYKRMDFIQRVCMLSNIDSIHSLVSIYKATLKYPYTIDLRRDYRFYINTSLLKHQFDNLKDLYRLMSFVDPMRMNPGPKSYIRQIETLSHGILDFNHPAMKNPYVCMSGGMIEYVLNSNRIETEYKSSDFDIWVLDPDSKLNVLPTLLRFIRDQVTKYYGGVPVPKNAIRYSNAYAIHNIYITLPNITNHIHIQIINSSYTTPDEVIFTFDCEAVMSYIYMNTLYISYAALSAILNKKFAYSIPMTKGRRVKYKARGYEIFDNIELVIEKFSILNTSNDSYKYITDGTNKANSNNQTIEVKDSPIRLPVSNEIEDHSYNLHETREIEDRALCSSNYSCSHDRYLYEWEVDEPIRRGNLLKGVYDLDKYLNMVNLTSQFRAKMCQINPELKNIKYKYYRKVQTYYSMKVNGITNETSLSLIPACIYHIKKHNKNKYEIYITGNKAIGSSSLSFQKHAPGGWQKFSPRAVDIFTFTIETDKPIRLRKFQEIFILTSDTLCIVYA